MMDEQETAHIRTLNEQATKIYRLNKINAELLAACKAAVRTIETLERDCAERKNHRQLHAAIARAEEG